MARDWSNDRYVRLFKPSVDHRALCWQARVIWPLLMQEANGAGVLRARKGLAAIANAIDVPLEVVDPGVADLLADGCLELMPDGYIIRNYVAAQTAIMSSNSRKARQREVDEAVAAIAAAAELATQAGSQTGHASSHDATGSHDESRPVTPSRAEPSRRSSPDARASEPVAAPVATASAPVARDSHLRELHDHAIDRLNAARAKVDPAAPPLSPIQGKPGTDLLDRLREVSAEQRKATLDHAIDVMVATLDERRDPVGEYRLAMLVGPNAWPRWCAGTVAGAKASSRPQSRGDPSSGAASPAASHGTGTIDPKTIRPRKP